MRLLRILTVAVEAALALAVVPAGLIHAEPPAAPMAQANLLRNPDFEGTFVQFEWYQTAQMAPDWTPWWKGQAEGDEAWKNRMPEYKPASPHKDLPWDARSGHLSKGQQRSGRQQGPFYHLGTGLGRRRR